MLRIAKQVGWDGVACFLPREWGRSTGRTRNQCLADELRHERMEEVVQHRASRRPQPWADIGSLYAFRKISVVGDKYRGTYALVQAVQSNKCEQCRQEVYPFFREVQIRSFHVLKSASESDIWMMQVYVLFMTLLCICLNNLFRCRRRVLLLFVWSSVGTCNYSVAAIHVFFFWAVQSRTDGRTHRHTGKFRSFIVGEYILFYLSGVLEFKIIQKLAKFCVIWQEKLHIYLRHTHLLGSTYYCGKKVNGIKIRNLGEN
jgi:hypothetical protein